jgi:hypothetical protein
LAAILITAGLLPVAAQAAPSPSPSPGATVDFNDQAVIARQNRANPVMEAVRELGQGRYNGNARSGVTPVPGVTDTAYAVHMYDQKTGGVIVFRVGGASDAAMAARYQALGTADVPVTVRDAVVTEKELMTVGQKIADDRAWRTAEGIIFASAGMEQEGLLDGTRLIPGKVYIGIENLTPEIEEKVLQRYADTTIGRDKVVVIAMLRPHPFVGGRQNDGPPWYGGGRTYGATTLNMPCTLGFGVQNYTGSLWATIALHCIREADSEGRRVYRPKKAIWYPDSFIGQVNNWKKDHDFGYMLANVDNLAWDGPYNTTNDGARKTVTRQKAPSFGMLVCVSGSFSGIRCGGQVATGVIYNDYCTRRGRTTTIAPRTETCSGASAG